MPRFLIEVSHESTQVTCARAVEVFLKTGSHFFTHADWGCKDGVHVGWAIVEAENREEAIMTVPTIIRNKARAVRLNKFTEEDLQNLHKEMEK